MTRRTSTLSAEDGTVKPHRGRGGRRRPAARRFGRRDVLKLGGAAAGGAALLPGCDTLELPGALPPPGEEWPEITTNDEFYVQSAFGTPQLDPASHRLVIRNDGVEAASLDLDWLEALGAREREHTLECIGTWPGYLAIDNAVWGGRPFAEILEALGVEPDEAALEMKFTCADGYETSIPVADLELPIWLVWRMNGEPVPLRHGAPFRFLVPGRYGMKNPKWPVSLDFIREPFLGYWEEAGWSNTCVYRTNGLILSPSSQSTFPAGEAIPVLGTAFAGSVEIAKVEMTADGGQTWEDAEITYQNGPDVWTLWRWEWTPPGPGEFQVQVRVTAADGSVSEMEPDPSERLSGYGGGMEITVRVE
jgi:DMSO/TMAO reductase YedYZ molybdopterin-dependent catalytic subunit